MGAVTDPIKAAQAMALGDSGMPSTQVAAKVGLPERTAYDIVHRVGRWGELADTPVFAKLRHEQNRALEATGRALAAKFWIHAEDNIDKLSPYQAVVAGSILIDKAQLLAGLPTSIIETHNLTAIANLEDLGAKLADAIALRQAGKSREIDVTAAADGEKVGK